MPTLPWTTGEAPAEGADAVVLGSRLELRAYRDVPRFLVAAMKVRRQVQASPGALGVSLIAQPTRKTFWTLSAWADQGSLDAFVGASPHTEIMKRFRDRLAHAGFTSWPEGQSVLPKAHSNAKALWSEAKQRLATTTGDTR